MRPVIVTGTRGALALAVSAVLLAGCTAADPGADGSSPSPEPTTASPSPTASSPEPSAEESSASPSEDAVDPRFPDPTTLVGGELRDESTGAGMITTIDGVPLDLSYVTGVCFGGDATEVCPYSFAAYHPIAFDGTAEISSTALVLLLGLIDRTSDGRAVWEVRDAQIVDLGAPGLVSSCDGTDGVLIASVGLDGATVVASAAWTADESRTHIVPMDPATLTCPVTGD